MNKELKKHQSKKYFRRHIKLTTLCLNIVRLDTIKLGQHCLWKNLLPR